MDAESGFFSEHIQGCKSPGDPLNSYCVDEFHDSFHWKAACGADSVNIVIKRH